MSELSYGIAKPSDLLKKLTLDGSKLTAKPHPHDVFNFVVTAAVLNEWILKYYSSHPTILALIAAKERNNYEEFPLECVDWLTDQTCLPNKGCDVRRHIMNAMSICWDTANASKHYHWANSSRVTAIEDEPQVKDWYQYFFTSVEPGLYIEYHGEYYTLTQLTNILTQFYAGLLNHIEMLHAHANPSDP